MKKNITANIPTYSVNETLLNRKYHFLTAGGLPSKKEVNKAYKLLLSTLSISPKSTVFNLECGYGNIGIVLANLASSGFVHLIDRNIRAQRFAEINLKSNNVYNAKVVLADTVEEIEKISFDVGVTAPSVHKGSKYLYELIEMGITLLKEGGEFYFVGKTDKGVRSVVRQTEEQFGNVEILRKRNKWWVVKVIKKTKAKIYDPRNYERIIEEKLEDGTYKFFTKCGLFSIKRIDKGTKLLLDSIEKENAPTNKILDWGCGYGAIGILMAASNKQAEVYLMDSDLRAYKAAQKNISLNGIKNAEAYLSDSALIFKNIKFSKVITNPPTHSGNDVCFQIIQEAYQLLDKNGQFYMVVMRPIGYEKEITRIFGNVKRLQEKNGYTILQSQKGYSS